MISHTTQFNSCKYPDHERPSENSPGYVTGTSPTVKRETLDIGSEIMAERPVDILLDSSTIGNFMMECEAVEQVFVDVASFIFLMS